MIEVNMPIVVIEVIPKFLSMRRRYRIMQSVFGLSAIEGEDHDFRVRLVNKSTIAFNAGSLEIVQFVIPSILGPGVVAVKGVYPIPNLAPRDETSVNFGTITFRAAGNAEMTVRVENDTQAACLWYQKQWSGDALINVNVAAKSNIYWLAITALNLVAAVVNLFFGAFRH